MKQLLTSYGFNVSAKTVTLNNLNVPLNYVLVIINATRNQVIYNLADPNLGAQSYTQGTNSVITLKANLAGHQNTDALTIFYDNGTPSDTVLIQGPAGANGKTVLSGSGDPVGTLGAIGDFYIKTSTNFIFGPKTSASEWPAGVSLVGPTGTNGTNGTNGNSVRSGATDPSASDGINGDFWINTTSSRIFGPKAGGAWPAGTNLVGLQGTRWFVVSTFNSLSGISNPATGDYAITADTGNIYQRQIVSTTPTWVFQNVTLKGQAGDNGTPGTPGTQILSGTSVPLSAQGVNNDFYIQTTSKQYWKKESGVWMSQFFLDSGTKPSFGPLVCNRFRNGGFYNSNFDPNFATNRRDRFFTFSPVGNTVLGWGQGDAFPYQFNPMVHLGGTSSDTYTISAYVRVSSAIGDGLRCQVRRWAKDIGQVWVDMSGPSHIPTSDNYNPTGALSMFGGLTGTGDQIYFASQTVPMVDRWYQFVFYFSAYGTGGQQTNGGQVQDCEIICFRN